MSSMIKVVKPSGILDATQAPDFRQEISQLVKEKIDIIVIDFRDVTFMDSSGLGALVLSLRTAHSAGSKLFLCSINEQIQMLFKLTSMDRVFEIFSSREELEQKILGK
ncbi:STAS domain-containing protein [Gloeothece verrucosa]|uniref:Anti-sigma factor antagonist n=1 Tax=Gloeothece verrucosa (strain PCC 7822) TaxID=497965 RepID=E0UFB4_GLOV7|nr:STAS domain-containing protein [Gloeothece verrucosa]ADN15485.1 anti-sigma-factor antagonist [Gloeothece verrucosa PCC 7822]